MDKKRALISVSDKTGIIELARNLMELDYQIISTGGTAKYLQEKNIPVTEVSEVTGFPECFDGRVKTLHPKIHGALLAKRDSLSHMKAAVELGIPMIDIVVVNLYPFFETIKKPENTLADSIEQIDIGGPAMLRSAAKNFQSVTVLTDINDYPEVISELRENSEISYQTRCKLAAKVFAKTAFYDSLIAQYLAEQLANSAASDSSATDQASLAKILPPDDLVLAYQKVADLRYGENPDQQATVYKKPINQIAGLTEAKQLHGKALSYNNYADTDAAIAMLKEFQKPTVVAVKHSNPCGIASGATIEEAFDKAYAADPVSIFGGIVVQNRPVSKAEAEKMAEIFLEVIVAESFEPEALEILEQKKNLRLLELPDLNKPFPEHSMMVKEIYGGLLVQNYDQNNLAGEDYQTVTKVQADEQDYDDYLFAMKVVKHVKSNAIVLVKNEQTVGIGPGQPNRITAAEIAIRQAGVKAVGAILGSDAFFPFSDTVKAAYEAGVKGIIQPGGSIRDQESIDFCDKVGIPMLFTGKRHFKH